MDINKYKDFYMSVAQLAASQSVAVRNKVGCVIVTESGSMFSGWNGTPPGWETNICEYEEDGQLVTKTEVIHAEKNALNKMLSEGVSSKGAVVFVTLSPCVHCALSLIGAKVSQVIYREEYRCTKGVDLLRKAGILVSKC